MPRSTSPFASTLARVVPKREGILKITKLLSLFFLLSGAVLANSHGPMGSVVRGHHFHGFPRGVAVGVYTNPYVFWNGASYVFGYGTVNGFGNRFGAISYSPTTGASGWGTGFTTLFGAQNEAYLQCSVNAFDCRNLMWFANSCAALSVSATNKAAVGWAWNTSAYAAAVNAQTQCSFYAADCVPQIQVCSY
jgi:hypothetical protein